MDPKNFWEIPNMKIKVAPSFGVLMESSWLFALAIPDFIPFDLIDRTHPSRFPPSISHYTAAVDLHDTQYSVLHESGAPECEDGASTGCRCQGFFGVGESLRD